MTSLESKKITPLRIILVVIVHDNRIFVNSELRNHSLIYEPLSYFLQNSSRKSRIRLPANTKISPKLNTTSFNFFHWMLK